MAVNCCHVCLLAYFLDERDYFVELSCVCLLYQSPDLSTWYFCFSAFSRIFAVLACDEISSYLMSDSTTSMSKYKFYELNL